MIALIRRTLWWRAQDRRLLARNVGAVKVVRQPLGGMVGEPPDSSVNALRRWARNLRTSTEIPGHRVERHGEPAERRAVPSPASPERPHGPDQQFDGAFKRARSSINLSSALMENVREVGARPR